MGFKQFIKNVFIFVWYLATQPFIEILKVLKIVGRKEAELAYLAVWRLPLLILTIVFYFLKYTYLTYLFAVLLFLTIIKTEWDERRWVGRARKKEREIIEQKLEQQGVITEESK